MNSDSMVSLRLFNLPILDIGQDLEPEGYLDVYIPSKKGKISKKKSVEVSYNRRDSAETLRKRIEDAAGMSIQNYYIVSDYGIIENGTTLDQYFPVERSKLESPKKRHVTYNSSFYEDNLLVHTEEMEKMASFAEENKLVENKNNKRIVLMEIGAKRNDYLKRREEVIMGREKRLSEQISAPPSRDPEPRKIQRNKVSGVPHTSLHMGGFTSLNRFF